MTTTKTLADWACADTPPAVIWSDKGALIAAVHATRHVADLCKALRLHHPHSVKWDDFQTEATRAADDLAYLAKFTQRSLQRGVPNNVGDLLVTLIEATTEASTILQVITGSGRYKAGGVDRILRRTRLLLTIRQRAYDQRGDIRDRMRKAPADAPSPA
jgi:hypothetical protein